MRRDTNIVVTLINRFVLYKMTPFNCDLLRTAANISVPADCSGCRKMSRVFNAPVSFYYVTVYSTADKREQKFQSKDFPN